MKATGGNATVHRHRPGHRRGRARSTGIAPALNTVCTASADGRGALHPHLRPPGLADVGVGPRRRRPDERPADRHADRLPRDDPDPPRGLRRRRGGRPADCPTGHLPSDDPAGDRRRSPTVPSTSGEAASYGEACSTSTSPAGRTAAPAATRRVGATASPASAARARSAGTSPAGHERPLPERSRT